VIVRSRKVVDVFIPVLSHCSWLL